MKDRFFLLRFHLIRRLERSLPADVFYLVIWVQACIRTAFRIFKDAPPALPLPPCLRVNTSVRTVRQWRIEYYLRQALVYFPDRLATAKWQRRCRINGIENLRQAQASGRPVIVAFSHFGPYSLIGYWLRAAGLPAATLVAKKSSGRGLLRLLGDELSPIPNKPTVMYMEQLRQVSGFLAARNTLLVAVDSDFGKQIDVPVGDGSYFRMAVGAIRMATRYQAELVACNITAEGPWRYRIDISSAAPREWLVEGADPAPVGKWLLDRMLPQIQAHPQQCPPSLIKAFQPKPATDTLTAPRQDELVSA